jgi:hypothetical protein
MFSVLMQTSRHVVLSNASYALVSSSDAMPISSSRDHIHLATAPYRLRS